MPRSLRCALSRPARLPPLVWCGHIRVVDTEDTIAIFAERALGGDAAIYTVWCVSYLTFHVSLELGLQD
jgi:hypothetical protein